MFTSLQENTFGGDLFAGEGIQSDAAYDALLNQAGDGVMGMISIPKINQMIPKDDTDALSDALRIRRGEDWLSLLTCTPYGINTHRMIVQARRVPYQGEEDTPTQPIQAIVQNVVNSVRREYTLYLAAALVPAAAIVFICRRKKRS